MEPVLRSRAGRTAVILDDVLANPDEVREFALKLNYQGDDRYFRGQRSTSAHPWPVVQGLVEDSLRAYTDGWKTANPTNGVFQFCVGGDQIVYHSDDNTHAAVLYLTPDAPPESGTTLYRSKKLKGRTVEEVLAARGLAKVFAGDIGKSMYDGKLLDPTAWEVVDVFGNRYNRLVIWDAKLVHSASCYFGDSKETGRLFQMFFFNVVR